MNDFDEIHHYTSDQKIDWFGYGEWVEEADEVNFFHSRLKCKILRIVKPDGPDFMFGGHLCGYVRIPPESPLFGKDLHYHYDKKITLHVHGGITFADSVNFLHDLGFWIGFDCGHSYDLIPCMKNRNIIDPFLKQLQESLPIPEIYEDIALFNPGYRNIAFCAEECKSLADQVANFKIDEKET